MAPWGAEAPPQKPGRRPRNMKRKISQMKNIPKEKLYPWNQIWIRQWFNCTSISNLYTWEAELKGATTQFYCWCCICKRKKVCLMNTGLFKILHNVVKKRERQLQLKIMQWWVNAGINTPVCSWPIACPNSTPSPPPHFHHNYHIFLYHNTTTITFTFFYLEIVTHIWWKWY